MGRDARYMQWAICEFSRPVDGTGRQRRRWDRTLTACLAYGQWLEDRLGKFDEIGERELPALIAEWCVRRCDIMTGSLSRRRANVSLRGAPRRLRSV